MRSHLWRPVFLVTIAVLALLTVSLVLAGCGGTTGGSGSSGSVRSYTDQTYGYSFEYPATWRLQTGNAASVTAGATARTDVGVFDPKGANSGDRYVDLAEVSIYQLKTTVNDSMMPDIKTQVQQMFDQMASPGSGWKALDQLADVKVGELPGWTISYSFNSNAGPSYCRFYVVFGGDIEYQLLIQAGAKNWDADQSVFSAFIASFKPGATSGTAGSTAE